MEERFTIHYHPEHPPLASVVILAFLSSTKNLVEDRGVSIPTIKTQKGVQIVGDILIAKYLAGLVGQFYGSCTMESSLVDQWIELVSSKEVVTFEFLLKISEHLKMRSFLVGYSWTLADVIVWSCLVPHSKKVTEIGHRHHCLSHFRRWWNFCQIQPEFVGASKFLITLPTLEYVPKDPREESQLVEKWHQIIMQFMEDPNSSVFSSPLGVSPVERKAIHSVCSDLGISSTSKGEGRHRFVLVEKRSRQEASSVSSVLKRKFQDDMNVKINMCEEQDWEYFLQLYNVNDKFQMLLDVTKECGSTEEFPIKYQEMVTHIANTLLAHPPVQNFLLEKDEEKWEIPFCSNLDWEGKVYDISNQGRTFSSV
eukprot:TRINITY_DN7839_c0_g1_i5.p1 TRINITY_DN7839_c0_g1~~TRINITY_DN7839_c0_g1_i5.p1  ORF type:complete len:367 (+),score=71.29 TRINITY_DN7839_c0_g1_i5:112-1212(+)